MAAPSAAPRTSRRTLPKRVPAMQTRIETGGGIRRPRRFAGISGVTPPSSRARRDVVRRRRGGRVDFAARCPYRWNGTYTPDRGDPPVSIGPAEIIIVLIIALLVFGPKRLPQMGTLAGQRRARVPEGGRDRQDRVRPGRGDRRDQRGQVTSPIHQGSEDVHRRPSRRSRARSPTSRPASTSSRPSRLRSRPPRSPARRRRRDRRGARTCRPAGPPAQGRAGAAARGASTRPRDAGGHAGDPVVRRRDAARRRPRRRRPRPRPRRLSSTAPARSAGRGGARLLPGVLTAWRSPPRIVSPCSSTSTSCASACSSA